MRALTGSETERLNDSIEGRKVIRRLQAFVDQGRSHTITVRKPIATPEEIKENIRKYLNSES